MGASDISLAFASASAALVKGVDGASSSHVVLADSVRLLGAHSGAVLLRLPDERPELLVATSHEVTDLELYQLQTDSGPCLESIDTGHRVYASGEDELRRRWPVFAPAMLDRGYHAIQSCPLRWRDLVIGAVNLVWTNPPDHLDGELIQGFADIMSLGIMQSLPMDDLAHVSEQMSAALAGRVVIERAKGVLSQSEKLDVAEAFRRLVELSRRDDASLVVVARRIVTAAYRG